MISEVMIAEVATLLDGRHPDRRQSLLEHFPDVRFTWCSDDDVSAAANPVAQAVGINLYLVGAGAGCLALTNDFANAAGVVVAEVEADD